MTQDLEKNKQLARRFLELVSAHDVEAMCVMITSDWTMVGGPPNLPKGRAGIEHLFGTFGSIEQTWIIEDVIAEGDRVFVRATNRCKQDSFFGIPSHGREQVFSAMFLHRIVDGKIAQTWRNADDLGRLLQLGAQLSAPK
jgi:ketosteroid isomerase-like protein